MKDLSCVIMNHIHKASLVLLEIMVGKIHLICRYEGVKLREVEKDSTLFETSRLVLR